MPSLRLFAAVLTAAVLAASSLGWKGSREPPIEALASVAGAVEWRPTAGPSLSGHPSPESVLGDRDLGRAERDGVHMRVRLRGLHWPEMQAARSITAIEADLYVSTWKVPATGGEVLLVDARLVNSTDGRAVWSRSFLTEADDLDALEGELRRAIAEAVSRSIETGTDLPTI